MVAEQRLERWAKSELSNGDTFIIETFTIVFSAVATGVGGVAVGDLGNVVVIQTFDDEGRTGRVVLGGREATEAVRDACSAALRRRKLNAKD